MLRLDCNPAILRLMHATRKLACGTGLLVLLVAACDDGPNVQYLPIGSRCSSDSDCGTKPYNCVRPSAGYPGGYCQKDCSTPGDCPLDSLCVAGECRRDCDSLTKCRTAEGYVCTGGGFCDIPSAVDAGQPD
jgi:hypothetical protein